jgi:hypothetical protein
MKRMARFTEPYHMLPAGIFREDEYLKVTENRRDSYRQQVLNGIEVGKGYRLRLFPVWFERRGNAGTGLSQTKAVSSAAHLRGDISLAALAHEQLQWLVGRNPFVQSLMYGEGYDYPPQYTPMSGDMAGALPVGIETRLDNDVPYWPPANCYNYKEVWVQPVARWIYIMTDLFGPSVVTGYVVPDGRPVVIGNRQFDPDPVTGVFRATVPAGKYIVRHGAQSKTATLLPGGMYALDLRPESGVELATAREMRADGQVTLRVSVRGSGRHRLSVRADNLTVSEPDKEITLTAGSAQTLVWRGKTNRIDAPWVAVVIPDGDLSQKQEIIGSTKD